MEEDTPTAVRAIRRFCIECVGGGRERRSITWCPTTNCPLWPFRFGKRPATVIQYFGPEILDPKEIPVNVEIEKLPVNPRIYFARRKKK